jgi:arylsulfatase A-like enzyme
MRFCSFRFYIFILTGLLLIVGCGGGSGESGSVVTPVTPATQTPTPTPTPTPSSSPNILLIISDDQGLDASAQYDVSSDLPNTPTLNELANKGLVFENAWATPACTTTRATLLTGKYGVNSGVTFVPAQLSNEHQILQDYIEQEVPDANYVSAVFGKWHLGGGNSAATHPNDIGVDYYAGNLSNVSDYFDWELTVNGTTTTVSEYHTSHITDLASTWISEQTSPWFAWVAYAAPHSPFHLPPATLHNRTLSGETSDINANRRDYYLAAIEAMDSEIGRLIDELNDDVKENTLIIFLGDNGTPGRVIDASAYISGHSKGSLYQGGVSVPLVISGAGVTRAGEREAALVTATDLYATIAEVAGAVNVQVNDSKSFASLFDSTQANTNATVFTQFESSSTTGVAVRNDNYKLIEYADGTQELFDVSTNFAETSNLINDPALTSEINALSAFADSITNTTNNQSINITDAILTNQDANCGGYVASYTSNVNDVARSIMFIGDLSVQVSSGKCIFSTNAIPNHDFNDGGNAFPNNVSEQDDVFEITTTPAKGQESTPLSLRTDNAILLNGVKVDLLAAGCFGVGDGKVGCNDVSTPWRYDPMHPANGFRVDSHNAHAQGDGTYHYHGSPFALFADDNSNASPVIGFAADGFPIYGSYIDSALTQNDEGIRKATSSYRLKEGPRLNEDGSIAAPGGNYDGAFRDDYEYVEGLGDLDECNGMTINGQYAYYITENYPYVLACFSGTPDASFNK